MRPVFGFVTRRSTHSERGKTMLKYFIEVTEDLLIPAVLLGMLYAVVGTRFGRRGNRTLTIGVIAGAALALIYSVLRNFTTLTRSIPMSLVYAGVFTVSVLGLIAALALALRQRSRPEPGRPGTVLSALLAFTAGSVLFYTLPNVFSDPVTFASTGDSIFSTEILFRLLGWLLGILMAVLIFAALIRLLRRMRSGAAAGLLAAMLVITGLQQIFRILQALHNKRIVTGHVVFVILRELSNHSNVFLYLTILVAVIAPVALWLRSLRVNEPYSNPAEHRKIRAKWRNTRRWSGLLIVCLILAVLCMTWFTALDGQTVELSPIEESELRDDAVYVSLTQVDDGHLHRFAYTTPDGVEVRFIVIQKPNSSSYGVGLDACDVCGETGYYERGDQIVCKLCDVVMNINTIGFKGGCNPIVIDYSVSDGYIIVPTYTLIEHQDEFK